MLTVKLELSEIHYNTYLSVAKRLYDEDVLEEPTIAALLLHTLQIMNKEYGSDPQSLVMYFKKRKAEDEIK